MRPNNMKRKPITAPNSPEIYSGIDIIKNYIETTIVFLSYHFLIFLILSFIRIDIILKNIKYNSINIPETPSSIWLINNGIHS